MSLTEPFEPKTLKQAKANVMWEKWWKAMIEELKSLTENATWTLIPCPSNRRVLRGKWVYKHKRGPNREILQYKA